MKNLFLSVKFTPPSPAVLRNLCDEDCHTPSDRSPPENKETANLNPFPGDQTMKTKQSFFRGRSITKAFDKRFQSARLPSVVEALSFVLFLFSFIFYLSSCKRSTEPIINSKSLQLQVLDVSCTEAWLSLKAKSDYLNKTFKLYQNDSLKMEKTLTTEDSILYVTGLWPGTSYQFQATVYDGNKILAKSPKVTATTLDTTSHDFTWQTFEFGGQGGSSYFKDVAIIDENDIWAVGEIYTADGKYNAAHWDGDKWELKKIDWDGYVSRLTCVFAFSSNDVWFGVTNLIHWNGNRFEKNINPVLNQFYSKTVNKIWGTSDNDLYIVGNDGLIAHYDGKQWQRIESGTDEKINDIYGVVKDNKKAIYCVFGKVLAHSNPGVLKIEENTAIPLDWPYDWRDPHSVWLDNPNIIYVAGADVELKAYSNSWKIIKSFKYYLRRMRGNSKNDLFITGDYGFLVHFNGFNWYVYESGNSSKIYWSLDFKENIVVSVGDLGGRKAAIKMGIRQ